MRAQSSALILLALAGCAHKRVVKTGALPAPKSYVDLRPGQRLEIVAPITKDGTNKVIDDDATSTVDEATRVITLNANSNFLGYETTHWEVAETSDGGVKLRLESATITKDYQTLPTSEIAKAKLRVPSQARHIRVFFPTSSQRMMIAGADRADRLDNLSEQLRTQPAKSCHNTAHAYCEWIPVGIAVRTEQRKVVNGVERWVSIY